MMEDSFMQIVREKLINFDFIESTDKPGLFFNSFMEERITYYIDMRRTPMRMYAYDRRTNKNGIAMPHDQVDEKLKEIKNKLITIGCEKLDWYDENKTTGKTIIKSNTCPHCGKEI